jgi:hypothetical protein
MVCPKRRIPYAYDIGMSRKAKSLATAGTSETPDDIRAANFALKSLNLEADLLELSFDPRGDGLIVSRRVYTWNSDKLSYLSLAFHISNWTQSITEVSFGWSLAL